MEQSRTIGGRYEVGDVLGRGGMAEVRRGLDLRLNRPVAIKQLALQLAVDPTAQERFRREAQAVAMLAHPSIAAVYDSGEEVDPTTGVVIPYMVMELVAGSTLRELLMNGQRFDLDRALSVTRDIAAALSHSHQAGIVHRDVKPANVMITPTGDVKVMDFGIARAADDTTLTQTSAVIGTAQYLSPEQARGESVDHRSDLYSLGCLLYELLTGRTPFVGDSSISVAYQHVREDPVPPSQLDPALGPDVDAVVLKALAKSPADRYQTADDMAADLDRLMAGEPVLAAGDGGATVTRPTVAAAPPPRVLTTPAPTAALPAVGAGVAAGAVAAAGRPAPERRRGAGWTVLVVALVLVLAGAVFAATRLAGPNSPGTGEATTGGVGPATATIPKGLVGRDLDAVEKRLNKAGFTKIRAVAVDAGSDVDEDEVVDIDPPAGSEVALTDTITVSYAGDQPADEPTKTSTEPTSSAPTVEETADPTTSASEPTQEPTKDDDDDDAPTESEPTRSSSAPSATEKSESSEKGPAKSKSPKVKDQKGKDQNGKSARPTESPQSVEP